MTVALEFREAGEGFPFLLLHGFPFTNGSFGPQLDAPPAGARILAPDHRGFGKSPADPSGTATMDELADDALALLDRLKIQQAIVGGVSMGGYAALALLRRDPSRVAGLALLDTTAMPDDAAGKERRETSAKDVLANGLNALVDGLMTKLFAPTTPKSVKDPLEQQMRAANPASVAAALRGMAVRTDTREVLSRYAGPLLVIVGEHDAITPPERAKQMAELVKGSTLVTIKNAGHLANIEQPAEVNAALSAFAKLVAKA
jgi:pimeloyl-ACP methyl ester carboxylesterase